MIYLQYITVFIFLFCCRFADAQELPGALEDKLEQHTSGDDGGREITDLTDELHYYLSYPLDLNSATREELLKTGWLNDLLVTALLEHIHSNGKLLSIYELQAVNGFDLSVIDKIKPFIRVDSTSCKTEKFTAILKEGTSQFIIRYQQTLEKSDGFISQNGMKAAYAGSPGKIYSRFRFHHPRKISIGITGEKDAGEEFFKGSNLNGFDFYSGHLSIRNTGIIRSLILGDYIFQSGQGLACWQGFSFGKSSDVTGIKKNGSGIVPFTSMDENNFLRGAAGTVAWKKWAGTFYYSKKKKDANVISRNSSGDPERVSSLQTTGYHRTDLEISDRRAAGEQIIGSRIEFESRRINAGITGSSTRYDVSIQPQYDPYRLNFSPGKPEQNLSFDYSCSLYNMILFGEAAIDRSKRTAYLNGAMLALSEKISLAILHRRYNIGYHAANSSGFSETGATSNEEGVYTGLHVMASRKWSISAYYDLFRFPWLQYQADAPSIGNECLLHITWTPVKRTEIYVRMRQVKKQKNGIDYLLKFSDQDNLRIHASYPISSSLSFRSRMEWCRYQTGEKSDHGFLILQDIIYRHPRNRIGVSIRYSLFETSSYDARIYAYENDVSGSFVIPPYYYRGSRTYLNFRYSLFKRLDLWIRIAQWLYTDRNTISSGNDEILGNTKTELKLQLSGEF